jgi:hypothetical protein
MKTTKSEKGVRHDRIPRLLASAVLALCALVLLPDVAHACPVCFDARDENRQAFIATAVFLSVLPLSLVAGAGLWIRKRSKDADAEDAREAGEPDHVQ